MSGICGLYFLDGRPVTSKPIEDMRDILSHRGPDDKGSWSSGHIGLGHRMLWTTPESLHEKLPYYEESDDLAITADARIDNRKELFGALGLDPGQKASDSQLILWAYKKWGEDCPGRLLGDFAFAIWDGKKQTLFCARDHMGVKPFYYYRSKKLFAFASEIKGLLILPEVPRQLNEMRVADYLVPILEDKEITFYKDILRLPPAHTMMVNDRGALFRQYWSLDPEREIRLQSDQEYAEAFRKIFFEAVRCRLRSAYPVGSMLSGGLDSSSIVCVARQILAQEKENGELHTFSAIFDDVPECDERPYINAVLAQGRIGYHFVHADRISPLVDIDRVLWHEDEAFYTPNLFMHWGLYDEAHRQGVRVILDGFDGDSVVSHGIGRLAELAGAGRWLSLAREINRLSFHFKYPRRKILLKHGLKPLFPEPLLNFWRWMKGEKGYPITPIIKRDLTNRINLYNRLTWKNREMPARTDRENHLRRLTSGIFPFVLEVADRASAAFALEPRYPFLDKRLVEFCLALPSEQKLNHGWSRIVMRRAMSNILPEKIQWRGGKSDLSPNFLRGLRTFEHELLKDVISNGSGVIEDYVDMRVLRQAHDRYMAKGTEADAMTVWKAVSLALWLRRSRWNKERVNEMLASQTN